MAKAPNGILDSVHGSVGKLTFYKLNGQNIVRKKAKYKDAPTVKQLCARDNMRMVMNFFTRIKPFIKVGYINESRGTTTSYFNRAVSHNLRYALTVEDGKNMLNYSKIKLSSGLARIAKEPSAVLTPTGLTFSWLKEPELKWITQNDQVMMMAYFPEDETAIFELSGAKRSAGTDLLVLPQYFQGRAMELYISFVSDDRLSVSDSVYIGRLN